MGRVARIIACTATLVPAVVVADGNLWDSLQLHGFASQAVIRTSDNNFFGESPKTSFDFTEVGINASLRPFSKLLLSGQALYRRAGDMYPNTLSVDYALADITALSLDQGRAGLRIGRIKNPLGLYNETRDMPFTRPSIFLPQVVYYERVRNLVLASDGVSVYADWFSDFGDLSLTLVGGQPQIDGNVEWSFLGTDWPGHVEPNETFWAGSLWYNTAGERVKVGLSGATSSFKFDPNPGSTLKAGTTAFDYWIASFQYNAEDWTFSTEYVREPVQWEDYGVFFPDQKVTAEGYYFQGAYHIRPNVQLLLRYGEGFANRYDRDGTGSSAASGGFIPPFSRYSKIWTASLRWDINRHLMARAEYQRHDGTFFLSNRENPDFGDLVREWDVFALQLSVRF